MGQRQASETVAAVVSAFLVQRTWKQADLAKRVEVGVPALKKCLLNLQASGVPLSDEADPPHVFWSVPKTWFPGGVLIPAAEVGTLLRHLARLPKSKDRDRLLQLALRPTSEAIVSRAATTSEERFLSIVEDATAKQRPLRFRYYTVSRGTDSTRTASVHRVLVGPPARFLATCHRTGAIKWFRVDNISDAGVDEAGIFRAVSEEEIERTLRGSLNGYQGVEKLERHVFFVREPDARGVVKNLLEGMQVEETSTGIRVTLETTALVRLARYVVGLGKSATAETETLRAAVRELAQGALEANGYPSSPQVSAVSRA